MAERTDSLWNASTTFLAMNEMYTDLKTFRESKSRLRAERDNYLANLDDHWDILRNERARSAMLKNTAVHTLRKLGPYRAVDDLLHGRFSMAAFSGLGVALGSMQRSPIKRMLFTGGSALLGKLFGGNEEGKGFMENILERVGDVVRKFRSHPNEEEETILEPGEMTHSR